MSNDIRRDASVPAAGFARTGVAFILATFICNLACTVLPAEVCSESSTTAMVGVLTAAISGLGKWFRDQGWAVGNLF